MNCNTRDADDMREIDAKHAPRKSIPSWMPSTELFIKVDAARRLYEREVTAFAAHGAYAARRTEDAGANRVECIRTTRQGKAHCARSSSPSIGPPVSFAELLAKWQKLDAGSETDRRENLIAGQLIGEVADSLKPDGGSISVEIDPELHKLSLRTNRDILTLAIRNLHENAVQHTPDGGTVSWRVTPDGGGALRSKTKVPGLRPPNCLLFRNGSSVASTRAHPEQALASPS